MRNKNRQAKTLTALLSGKHPRYSEYEGKHVLVANEEVVLLREGPVAREDFKQLKEKHGHAPTVVFSLCPTPRHLLHPMTYAKFPFTPVGGGYFGAFSIGF